MIVRLFWKNCSVAGTDAVWVEATKKEAEAIIFPRLTSAMIAESRKFSDLIMAERMGNPGHSYCFLVEQDLGSIVPKPVHYPIHNLWNGYSPFEEMEVIEISNIDEIRDIVLPASVSHSGSSW